MIPQSKLPLLLLIGMLSSLISYAGPRQNGSHRADFAIDASPSFPRFRIQSMDQKDFTDQKKKDSVTHYKHLLQEGKYDYTIDDQVSGFYYPETDTYYVGEGHTRLAAALEIAKDTDNWSYFKKLVQTGKWDEVHTPPPTTYPLFMRASGFFDRFKCLRIVRELAN